MIDVRSVLLLAAGMAAGCGSQPDKPATHPVAPAPTVAAAPAVVQLRFMEPVPGVEPVRGKPRVWKPIVDAARLARLHKLADNEPARFARALYAEAWRLIGKSGKPVLHIGVEKGGNYARRGFSLTGADGATRKFPGVPYLILGDRPSTFRNTFLHESGHAIHALLIGSGGRPRGEAVAPIPHSTAAITDRRTAFNEGFAIHLETINAHCGRDPLTRRFYQRRRLRHGSVVKPGFGAEYYAAVKDMLSYAQSFARYQHVRDGLYVFEPAVGGNYLRAQLTPARDRRELRSPNALVASEGVVASVVFQVIAADGCASLTELVPRYRPVFEALRRAETTKDPLDAVPLLDWIASLRIREPKVGARAVRVFLDLSRGVTVDARARNLWQELYDAALNLDLRGIRPLMRRIEMKRAGWLQRSLASPRVLATRIGPVVAVQTPRLKVGLVIFGRKQPLSFDANAVSPAVLGLVPGMDARRVKAIIAERRRTPFKNVADFVDRLRRLGIPDGTLVALSPGR